MELTFKRLLAFACCLLIICSAVFAEDVGKTKAIDFSGFSLWDKSAGSFDPSTNTISYKTAYAGGCVFFDRLLDYTGFNYIEVNYEADNIWCALIAEYGDGKKESNGFEKGKGVLYLKLAPGKKIKQLSVMVGNYMPYTVKINSIRFVEKAPAYLTTPVVDKGKKSLDGSKSAMDFVKNLTIGWNLGNSFDSVYFGDKDAALASYNNLSYTVYSDLTWGNVPATKELIQLVHKSGFDLLRLPVTWKNHIIDDKYTIDPLWMAKVKQVVDWAIEDGMYVLLDEHHSVNSGTPEAIKYGEGYQVSPASKDESEKFLKAVWEQICVAFNNGYDEHLIFEVLNEPRNTKHHAFWEYEGINTAKCAECAKNVKVLNGYNQLCLDTIRASGGNNANRYVVIPGMSTAVLSPVLKEFEWPKDSSNDKLILAIHDYYYSLPEEGSLDPKASKYAVASSHKKFEEGRYKKLNERYMSKGIPLLVTESSCAFSNPNGVPIDRNVWYDYYLSLLGSYGARMIWWDNGYDKSAIINRVTLKLNAAEMTDTTAFVNSLIKSANNAKSNAGAVPAESSGKGTKKSTGTKQAASAKQPAVGKSEGISILDAPVSFGMYEKTVSLMNFIQDAESGATLKIVVTGKGDIRFTDNSWQEIYLDGKITGGKPNTTASRESGMYGNITLKSGGTITYTPTAEVWEKMKTGGLLLVGQGLTVKDVILCPKGEK